MKMMMMVITINSCLRSHGQGTWREILMVPAKIRHAGKSFGAKKHRPHAINEGE